jgi:protein TonB
VTTPLRLGFLFSGLLHVAVVAAFSLSSNREIPALDEPRPLTLRLALFEPAQVAPSQQLAVEQAQPEPVEQPIPPDEQTKPTPLAETPPEPVAKKVEPRRSKPKPEPVVQPLSSPKPAPKPPTGKKPVKVGANKAKPPEVSPAPLPIPTVARATAIKPQPVAAALDPQEKQHYLAALAAKINRSKYYPTGSRRRGEEGKVVVRFIVQKNGELTDFTIVESSGSRRLDAAALKTLRRVTPFRPIPDDLNRDHWPISVPIAFSLGGRS